MKDVKDLDEILKDFSDAVDYVLEMGNDAPAKVEFFDRPYTEAKTALLALLESHKQTILKHDGTDSMNVTNYVEVVPMSAIRELFKAGGES